MEPGGTFGFQHLPSYKFPGLEKSDTKEKLLKWSMVDGLKVQAYSFDKPFRKYNERDFITDFLASPNVVSSLMKATINRTFSPIGVPVDIVKFSAVICTLTTLEIFDKLRKDDKVVRQNGSIVKCMPHYIRAGSSDTAQDFEIEIADNLRKLTLSNEDESEDFDDIKDVLTEDDKKEFLYSLFTHLVIGGSLCQYEDNIEPYIQILKLLYKDLIAVAGSPSNADADDKSLAVISFVYKIHFASSEISEKKNILFHQEYLNNFFYIIVNPLKQLCFTVYHHV